MEPKNYSAVRKHDILRAYLHHFSLTSMKNEVPGLLSFFFVQGQAILPYVRIPTGDTHLDPRVHVFWIQPSRTGKSIAWNFISDICEQADVPIELFASGTDAGLIGSTEAVLDDDGKPTGDYETIDGLLAGRKAINFDEGSIILNPGKHSQETVLYLQTACNPVGSGNNTLVKHMKGNKVRETQKWVRDKLLNLAEISFTTWDEMSKDEKEELVQSHMWDMFTADENYEIALHQASEEVYDLLRDMDPSMSEIVASFTPAIENYLGIFSTHMAVLERSDVIQAHHVDMAHEILLDLFINLISWLEDSVEIGGNKNKEQKLLNDMMTAYNACQQYELDQSGDGWRRKQNVVAAYMSTTGLSKSSAERHFKDFGAKLFTAKKSSGRIYLRRKGDA